MGFFNKLKDGLTKTRNNIMGNVENIISTFTKIDDEFYEELEEALICADLGVNTTLKIIEDLKQKVKINKISDTTDIKQLLKDELKSMVYSSDRSVIEEDKKNIILVIGVNGVGKTTSIGKLANQFKNDNKKVLLAAADTFRAAAIDQLKVWSDRANVDIIYHQEKADPAAVIYDAVQACKARKTDVLLCDTAGRLHNKKNLMEELRKISTIIDREFPDAHKEVLLVLDSTTGQNAVLQAKLFKEVSDITGIILTKLDGTAKGGVVISIINELNIPVKYIGVGEGIDDLQPFNPEDFIDALFDN